MAKLTGEAAMNAALAERVTGEDKGKRYLSKNSPKYRVHFEGVENAFEIRNHHSSFGRINSAVPIGHNYYNDVANYYFKEAKKYDRGTDENKFAWEEAREWSEKELYCFGFTVLETGNQIVLHMESKKQAAAFLTTLNKNKAKLNKKAFDLEKIAGGSSIDPIDLEDLSKEEKANFDKAVKTPFDSSRFDLVMFEADEERQLENIRSAGFNTELIGVTSGDTPAPTISEEKLPF